MLLNFSRVTFACCREGAGRARGVARDATRPKRRGPLGGGAVPRALGRHRLGHCARADRAAARHVPRARRHAPPAARRADRTGAQAAARGLAAGGALEEQPARRRYAPPAAAVHSTNKVLRIQATFDVRKCVGTTSLLHASATDVL